MAQAKKGDRVKVHYVGTLEDGSVFDASEDSASGCADSCGGEAASDACGCGSQASGPLEFVIGEGRLLPKFEEAVIGLEPGQSVKVKIAATDAYGERADEMVAAINRSEIPEGMDPKEGDHMEVVLEDGTPLPVLVIETSETSITLDANHPLAGKDLTFDIKLVEIV